MTVLHGKLQGRVNSELAEIGEDEVIGDGEGGLEDGRGLGRRDRGRL